MTAGIPTIVYKVWDRTPGYRTHWSGPTDPGFIAWLQDTVDIPQGKIHEHTLYQPNHNLINHLAFEIYRMRKDLQASFPDPLGRERIAYARWFMEWANQQQLSPAYYDRVEKAVLRREKPARIFAIPEIKPSRCQLDLRPLHRQATSLPTV